jgi:hypothetical protein
VTQEILGSFSKMDADVLAIAFAGEDALFCATEFGSVYKCTVHDGNAVKVLSDGMFPWSAGPGH